LKSVHMGKSLTKSHQLGTHKIRAPHCT
jgi:hypothetical protein